MSDLRSFVEARAALQKPKPQPNALYDSIDAVAKLLGSTPAPAPPSPGPSTAAVKRDRHDLLEDFV